jgi:hypothetical protein
MRILLALALLCASSVALASPIGGSWRMSERTCTDGKVLGQIPEKSRFIYTFGEQGNLDIVIADASDEGPLSGCHAKAEAKYALDSAGNLNVKSIEKVESNCAQVSMQTMEKDVLNGGGLGEANVNVSEDGKTLTLAYAKSEARKLCAKGKLVANVFTRVE